MSRERWTSGEPLIPTRSVAPRVHGGHTHPPVSMWSRRSFLERAVSFPENIEVEATHTYATPLQIQAAAPQPNPNAPRPGSATVVMHFSMVRLPEQPMIPRLFDERVGYFNVQQIDYGREEHRAERRRFITRWRLEK